MKKTQTKIYFEQRELWRISRAVNRKTQICPHCFDDSPMISPEDLAVLANLSPREIYRRIESGFIHFVETESLEVFVCLTSFSKKESIK